MILKLIGGFIVASAISVFVGVLSLFILKYVVDIFQLNHNKDAYWVFTASFYIMIVTWILSFIFSLVIIDK
jgi:hypothetical protein